MSKMEVLEELSCIHCSHEGRSAAKEDCLLCLTESASPIATFEDLSGHLEDTGQTCLQAWAEFCQTYKD